MKSLFTIPENLLYFNSANLSFCPTSVLHSIDLHRRQFEENPTQGLKNAWKHLWKVQSLLANFYQARPTDLILRTNVTDVLNTFILGFPLNPKDEILISDLEYGSVINICKFKAEKENLGLRMLKIPQSPAAISRLTEASLLEHIESQLNSQTKVLVISHVIASLGWQIPIKKLADLTQTKGIALIVDGAYAPGALNVDFKDLERVDFYGCSLYKWMMGPKGTGFGWVNPKNQPLLKPLIAGWTTFDSQGPFFDFGGGSRFQQKFQLSGCRDFSPFFAIEELLKFWQTHSPQSIQNKIQELNGFFRNQLSKTLKIDPVLPADPKLNGPMTVFRVPQKLQSQGFDLGQHLLLQFNIQLHFTELETGWYGVFSPHIYNSEDEIDKALQLIKPLFD